jgi:predicted TIM-barrel fold metal-dependent hydrolase
MRLFDVHSHFCGESKSVEGFEDYIASWTQPEFPGGDPGRAEKKSLWISRAFPVALRELYGTSNTDDVVKAMNEIRAKGLIASMEWMRKKSNVGYLVVDSNRKLASKNDWIFSTYHFDASQITDSSCDLSRRLDEIEREVREGQKEKGISCLKVAAAYLRTLYFEDVPFERASKIAAEKPKNRKVDEQKQLEDYIYRYFFRKAGEWSMPVEIHTGFGWASWAGHPLRLSDADPENLLPVLEDSTFHSTQFILFHGGYPFISKMGYIAGAFSNVYLDFTCLCQESWSMLKRALHEWIDIVPMDRIVTGSDGSYEWLYFAAKYNRECLAEVLAEKVQKEHMNLELALDVAQHILTENAERVFKIK